MKKTLIFLTILFLTANTAALFESGGKVAVIQLNGAIMPTEGGGFTSTGGITPSKVRNLNSQATNQGADAIIYEWNSGGGSVVASKEVMRAMEGVNVPTVCRFRDVAASGAYLASMACDRIIADSASITGSIGVKSSYLQYSGLMEKYGVEYINITSGKYKEVGVPYKNVSEEEKAILREKTDIIHKEFLERVGEKRNLSESEMSKVRTGEIFLGSEAIELGLVDSIGGREEAITEAENLTGTNLRVFHVQSQTSFSLLDLIFAKNSLSDILNLNSVSPVPLRAEWG